MFVVLSNNFIQYYVMTRKYFFIPPPGISSFHLGSMNKILLLFCSNKINLGKQIVKNLVKTEK